MNQDITTPIFESTTDTKPKKKKYVLVFLAVGIIIFSCIVIGFVLIDNLKNDEEKIIGAWKLDILNITFFQNGKLLFVYDNGTWEIKDGQLVITVPRATIPTVTYSYVFSNDDKKLTLTDINNMYSFSLTKQ